MSKKYILALCKAFNSPKEYPVKIKKVGKFIYRYDLEEDVNTASKVSYLQALMHKIIFHFSSDEKRTRMFRYRRGGGHLMVRKVKSL